MVQLLDATSQRASFSIRQRSRIGARRVSASKSLLHRGIYQTPLHWSYTRSVLAQYALTSFVSWSMSVASTSPRIDVGSSYPAIPPSVLWAKRSSRSPTASSSGPGSALQPSVSPRRQGGWSVYPLRWSHLPQTQGPRISHCRRQPHCQAPRRERGSNGGW
jgi:hypothetical protein